jgi:hypothetical protein
MEFNKAFIRTQSGILISALTGRRYNAGEEARLLKDNEDATRAANLRARAAGEPDPTPRQIRTGEFGDSRSTAMRIADEVAARNPRSEVNPYLTSLQVNLALQKQGNYTSKELEADAERLKAKAEEYEKRREKLASLPVDEPPPTPDPLRGAAAELRSAPTQPGEGKWRKLAADALDRRADENDETQQAAEAERARIEDPTFKRTILCATAQLHELELRGDVEQQWVNEARQTLSDIKSGAMSPAQFWSVEQPQHVERMTTLLGRHKAEISRRQAELDALEQAAEEGKAIEPPPAPSPAPNLYDEAQRRMSNPPVDPPAQAS